jgi:hypothetical protein
LIKLMTIFNVLSAIQPSTGFFSRTQGLNRMYGRVFSSPMADPTAAALVRVL